MNNLVIFDFDNTLARITHLHRWAWRDTLQDVGLKPDVVYYLPPEKFSLERFDSARRVRHYFFRSRVDRAALEFFFETDNADDITTYLLDLKESHLLYLLEKVSPLDMVKLYARNIFPAIDLLVSKGDKLGIISSTRESVVLKALNAAKLSEAFSFIIGEESLHDEQGNIYDKPLPFARAKIPSRMLERASDVYYIGDDVRIDSAFAKNCQFKYIQFAHHADLITICKLIG